MAGKFIVVMQICSALFGDCTEWHSNNIKYKSVKECLIAGYKDAIKIISELDEKYIAETQTLIRFACNEVNDET